jgi:hypothetical protein
MMLTLLTLAGFVSGAVLMFMGYFRSRDPYRDVLFWVGIVIMLVSLLAGLYSFIRQSTIESDRIALEREKLALENERLHNPQLVADAATSQTQNLTKCLDVCPDRGFLEGKLFPNVAWRCEVACYQANNMTHPDY